MFSADKNISISYIMLVSSLFDLNTYILWINTRVHTRRVTEIKTIVNALTTSIHESRVILSSGEKNNKSIFTRSAKTVIHFHSQAQITV